MAFPEAPRVLYEINPLDEVVSQLKFPPILRIDTETPAAFQEAIRDQFPLYRAEPAVNLTVQLPHRATAGGLANVGGGLFGAGAQKHIFETTDKSWQVTLTRESLGLTCRRKYDRWENFRNRLEPLLQSLSDTYRPPYFAHVCLRYRDVIRPWLLNLPANVAWSDLLRPWIAGAYSQAEVAADVESVQTRTVIRLPNGVGRLDASFGLATEQPASKNVFLIDAHLYKDGQTEPPHAIPTLNSFNRQAGLFFRWCITDRLHDALRPGDPILGPG